MKILSFEHHQEPINQWAPDIMYGMYGVILCIRVQPYKTAVDLFCFVFTIRRENMRKIDFKFR